MKTFKKSDFDFILINFEYQSQIVTIKAEPYRTLEYILERAINKMNKIIQLPDNISFYFLGKELNHKNSEKIGNIFNHREKVTIKIKASSSNVKEINSERNNLRVFHNNNIINKKNNIYLLNTKKLIFPKISKEIKLPLISNKENIIEQKDKDKEKEKEKENEIENPCNCGRLSISEYCRNCRKFICLKCKTELKHKNHLTMHLNLLNLGENVKNYGKILQDNIQKKIEINRNIFSKSETLDEATIITRKQKIQQKYKEAIQNYQNIIMKIKSKLESEDKERASLVINSYDEYSKNIIKQLNDLNKKLDKNFINNNKKLTFNDLRSFLDEINSKEESLNFFGKDVIKYHLKGEINTKMESSINKIDMILNQMCDEDSPFNLDNKYLEELNKLDILKINNEKKDKDKETIRPKDKELLENDNVNDNNSNNFIKTKNLDE